MKRVLILLVGVALSACSTADTIGGLGKTTSALQSYQEYMQYLSPVAWYKFDEAVGNVAYDSSGNGNHGIYNFGDQSQVDGPMLGVDGAVNDNSYATHYGTLNSGTATIVNGVYQGPYMSAPDSDNLSLTKGLDKFQRSVSAGDTWGTPNNGNGGTWTKINAGSGYYSVSGMAGNVRAYINETNTSGTFGQVFPANNMLDTDVRTNVMWTYNTSTPTGTFYPAYLLSRYVDSGNYYSLRLSETYDASYNKTLKMSIIKKSSGTTTTLVGPYTLSTAGESNWNIRFQVSDDHSLGAPFPATLKAKAWVNGTTQPDWQLTVGDGEPLYQAGKNAIMSSNSSSNVRPSVSFDDYKLQSAGFTVSVWMKPTKEYFTGSQGTLCSGTGATTIANYVHFIGKFDNATTTCSSTNPNPSAQGEWMFRHYPITANAVNPPDICDNNRSRAVSTYGFSLTPTYANPSNCSHKGAGERYNPSSTLLGSWHHVVGRYEPGDNDDLRAGITMCFDGVCYDQVKRDGVSCGDGANYCDTQYMVNMLNGTAPLRVGANPPSGWTQFQGNIDELSTFNRLLTNAEVAGIYSYKK